MAKSVDDFISVQMRRLEKSGEFDNNPHRGKPLDLRSYFRSPKDTRAIYKYLSDSGFKPPKLQLLEEVRKLEEEYKKTPTKELSLKLQNARLKYNLA